ncbi:PREDICTED: uncharacterized protein LOC105448319 [Wasmannia auropunctata]|uniref:uncharacterized protein LOC105448319 n=1 Tax=Wasmannia auropunctata TaxID=64793 RepID=UPI0005EE0931|nr:PREDICTED: uncharacterized protein LOC105448319 [Wasmannia auropunctata]
MNRLQNLSMISICKSPMWHCQEIYRIKNDKGWVDTPPEAPLFSINGSSYIAISPVDDGPAGFYKHIIWANVLRKQVVPLTHGKFEVVRILVWDQTNNTIYFIGIPFMRPGQRHLYRVSSTLPPTGSPLRPAICLTCTISSDTTNDEGEHRTSSSNWQNGLPIRNEWHDDHYEIHIDNINNKEHRQAKDISKKDKLKNRNVLKSGDPPCQYHNAIFPSADCEYFILECLGPGIPIVALYKMEMSVPRFIMPLQNNTLLREKIANIALPQVKTFPVQISGGYNAQVRLHLPPGLREDEITRYPLVVQV